MIIGISGQAGSGKDTCADIFVQEFNFVKIAFADPVKRICREVFDFSDNQLWGPSQTRSEPDTRYLRNNGEYLTPRHALQTIGTSGGRDCYEDIWAEHAIKTANKLLDANRTKSRALYNPKWGITYDTLAVCPYEGAIISDVRFRNEIDALRNSNALVFRVVRPGAGLNGEAAKHVSESEMKELPDSLFDEVIVNDGTIEDLRAKVAKLMKTYR